MNYYKTRKEGNFYISITKDWLFGLLDKDENIIFEPEFTCLKNINYNEKTCSVRFNYSNSLFYIIDFNKNIIKIDEENTLLLKKEIRNQPRNIQLKYGQKITVNYKNNVITGIITKIREKTFTMKTEDGKEFWRHFKDIL